MLYRPEAFEPLIDEPWDEARVRDGDPRRSSRTRTRPSTRTGSGRRTSGTPGRSTPPLKDLYCGAAGVVWALDALRRRGHAETRIDLAAAIDAGARALARGAATSGGETPLPSPPSSSLLCGESGILVVAWRLAPSADLADTLLARVRENVANEAEELMWGSPGTMLAAQAMHGWTGRGALGRGLARERGGAAGAPRRRRALDAAALRHEPSAHASARRTASSGTSTRCCRERPERRRSSARRPRSSQREAVVEDGLANWPAAAGEALEDTSGRDPRPVVPRRARDRRDRGAVPRRGAAARRRRADLAGGRARRREGRRPLPRHGRQRLRAPEGVRSHRRRALARAGPPLRRPRARAGRAGADGERPRPLLALHGRPRASRSSPPTASTRPPASPSSTAGTSGSDPT